MSDDPRWSPKVQGQCPGCGGNSLFLGSGGFVTCARLDCPAPCAATDLLASDEDKARAMDAVVLLAAVDEGAGDAYRTELRRRLLALEAERQPVAEHVPTGGGADD